MIASEEVDHSAMLLYHLHYYSEKPSLLRSPILVVILLKLPPVYGITVKYQSLTIDRGQKIIHLSNLGEFRSQMYVGNDDCPAFHSFHK